MVLLCLLSSLGTVAWYPPWYLAYGRDAQYVFVEWRHVA